MTQSNETVTQPGAKQSVEGGNGQMFDEIAERYDVLNRILSGGMDQSWRRKAVSALQLRDGDHVLDLATGTGDLAIMIAEYHNGLKVTGVDPSANMIAVGDQKIKRGRLDQRVSMTIGDGQNLPFEDNTFDGAVVAFGIRNFPDRFAGLQQMTRVTRPGRQVVILELSEPKAGFIAPFARAYIHHIVPRIGSALSGKQEYRYLQKSIEAFPSASEFSALMRDAGLKDVRAIPLSFGAVHLYVGTV